MPLIDIVLKPGYRMKLGGMRDDVSAAADVTRGLVKRSFAQALPGLVVEHAKVLRLDAGTPPEAVQVRNHDYGEDDVNIANLWVVVRLSEVHDDEVERRYIRDKLYELLTGWFEDQGFVPEDFVMDIFWGPTNGKGTVNGVTIAW